MQGLQEYDAIFHSTDDNATRTRQRLLQWARANSSNFSCCSPTLAIADAYNGGAAFMTFLAAEFGEAIHARLLRNSATTFDAALASETRPYSLTQLFERFRKVAGLGVADAIQRSTRLSENRERQPEPPPRIVS